MLALSRNLTIVLALCSCSKKDNFHWQKGFSTKRLETIVHTYATTFETTVNTKVIFVSQLSLETPKRIAAYYMEANRVEILSHYENHTHLELIVFHELGHAQGLKHYDTTLDIMNTAFVFWTIEWENPTVRQALIDQMLERM